MRIRCITLSCTTSRKALLKLQSQIALKMICSLSTMNSQKLNFQFRLTQCFCLGKYKPDAPRLRPILIKFLRATEASMALSKIASFKAPMHIKPDLTHEERQAEKVLLKERWTLVQLGFDKEQIKLRNKCIFIDNKLYSQYQNSELCHSNYNPPLPTKPSTTQSSSTATSAPDQ